MGILLRNLSVRRCSNFLTKDLKYEKITPNDEPVDCIDRSPEFCS
jgi:hypothetical protein